MVTRLSVSLSCWRSVRTVLVVPVAKLFSRAFASAVCVAVDEKPNMEALNCRRSWLAVVAGWIQCPCYDAMLDLPQR
jgi:hypothetical protein